MTRQNSLGLISHSEDSNRRTDYLYRISLKGLIRNEKGEILVVKETGRTSWDLPGGGMDHNEDIKTALARELKEEINFNGNFDYKIIHVDEPFYIESRDWWQARLIFEITPDNMSFSAGDDGDEIAFINANDFENSPAEPERRIFKYNNLLSK